MLSDIYAARVSRAGVLSRTHLFILFLPCPTYEMLAVFILLLSYGVAAVSAAVTVYGPQGVLAPELPSGSGGAVATTVSVDPATYTGAPAFNSIVLTPPPLPNPPPPTQFAQQLASNAQNVQGLSIPHTGDFLGFSIEMSVGNQISEYSCCFRRRITLIFYSSGSEWVCIVIRMII